MCLLLNLNGHCHEKSVFLSQIVLFQYEMDSLCLQYWEYLDVYVTFYHMCLWEKEERER
jgi:hypothetical protein